jgi:hypothetical protein
VTLTIAATTVPRPEVDRRALRPVAWTTVAVLAVVMAFADGFVLTAIQGAVGAVGSAQDPVAYWLWSSIALAPVFALAVLAAIRCARRLFGPALRSPLRVVGAALLIAVAGSAVGTAGLAVSAAYDYDQQSGMAPMQMAPPPALPGAPADACSGACAAERAQSDVHQKAMRLGSALDVGVNVVLVGWIVAIRGGRLERRDTRADEGT